MKHIYLYETCKNVSSDQAFSGTQMAKMMELQMLFLLFSFTRPQSLSLGDRELHQKPDGKRLTLNDILNKEY